MDINPWIVAAVLLGALLHASWNALIKSSTDKSLDTALIHSLGGVIALPVLLWAGLPHPDAWPFIAASTVVHLGYYATLAAAYKYGDLGLTYPIMRGSAPLLVALSSAALLGEPLSGGLWLGIVGICAGVLLLGLAGRGARGAGAQQAVVFALLNAVLIATYTIIDGLGVRAAGNALSYVAVLFLLDAFPYMLVVLWLRSPAQRVQAMAYFRGRWPIALVGTCASLGSYGIALWAMTHMPVAVVAALRETSVLFAVAMGFFLLRERLGWGKVIGALAIVGGVWWIRLA